MFSIMRGLLLVLSLVGCFQIGLSQAKVTGEVKDSFGSPVSFANIYAIHGDSTYGASSDFEGRFEIDVATKDSLHIHVFSLSGNFDTAISSIEDEIFLKVILRVDSLEIDTSFSSLNKKGALLDIEQGNVKLSLPGGIVGVAISAKDKKFEKKYGVNYYSRGCVSEYGENQAAYNKVVEEYLDQKFGFEWRKEVRFDVIGLFE